jgi:hypothetical protein
MSPPRSRRPHGQIRQSQVIRTFGPGALLELPNRSVIVGGLEMWMPDQPHQMVEIHEPRLVANVEEKLGKTGLRLYAPPLDEDDPTAPPNGITAFQFPEWFITQDVDDGTAGVRSRHLVHRRALDHRGRYTDDDRNGRPVVPVRFVRACRRGHIGDIDWDVFAHGRRSDCRAGSLRMDERGTSGDLSEISVRCAACGESQQLLLAAARRGGLLGRCDGRQPWLGSQARETCGENNRLLVRTATHAYFAQNVSVISLPEAENAVTQAVEQVWQHYLEYVETAEDLASERRKKPPVEAALRGLSDEQVLDEIRRRRAPPERGTETSIKPAELELLLSSREEIGSDKPDGTFYARALPGSVWEGAGLEVVDRVVLLHRLREVVAQVGFTRFEAISPDTQGELELGVERASIARELTWLPAVENRGEGFFLSFRNEAVERWARQPGVRKRGERLLAGFDAWQLDHEGSVRKFVGLPYVMLHTLSHMLLTAVSLECGYPASSIRERVYASARGYGILLYTATSGTEGTLGGLVEAGRRIREHLKAALELGRLCSNDPVCAQHQPDNPLERRFLLGAACHGCLLISETSCEQGNDWLDRALVVPTLADSDAAFFDKPIT